MSALEAYTSDEEEEDWDNIALPTAETRAAVGNAVSKPIAGSLKGSPAAGQGTNWPISHGKGMKSTGSSTVGFEQIDVEILAEPNIAIGRSRKLSNVSENSAGTGGQQLPLRPDDIDAVWDDDEDEEALGIEIGQDQDKVFTNTNNKTESYLSTSTNRDVDVNTGTKGEGSHFSDQDWRPQHDDFDQVASGGEEEPEQEEEEEEEDWDFDLEVEAREKEAIAGMQGVEATEGGDSGSEQGSALKQLREMLKASKKSDNHSETDDFGSANEILQNMYSIPDSVENLWKFYKSKSSRNELRETDDDVSKQDHVNNRRQNTSGGSSDELSTTKAHSLQELLGRVSGMLYEDGKIHRKGKESSPLLSQETDLDRADTIDFKQSPEVLLKPWSLPVEISISASDNGDETIGTSLSRKKKLRRLLPCPRRVRLYGSEIYDLDLFDRLERYPNLANTNDALRKMPSTLTGTNHPFFDVAKNKVLRSNETRDSWPSSLTEWLSCIGWESCRSASVADLDTQNLVSKVLHDVVGDSCSKHGGIAMEESESCIFQCRGESTGLTKALEGYMGNPKVFERVQGIDVNILKQESFRSRVNVRNCARQHVQDSWDRFFRQSVAPKLGKKHEETHRPTRSDFFSSPIASSSSRHSQGRHSDRNMSNGYPDTGGSHKRAQTVQHLGEQHQERYAELVSGAFPTGSLSYDDLLKHAEVVVSDVKSCMDALGRVKTNLHDNHAGESTKDNKRTWVPPELWFSIIAKIITNLDEEHQYASVLTACSTFFSALQKYILRLVSKLNESNSSGEMFEFDFSAWNMISASILMVLPPLARAAIQPSGVSRCVLNLIARYRAAKLYGHFSRDKSSRPAENEQNSQRPAQANKNRGRAFLQKLKRGVNPSLKTNANKIHLDGKSSRTKTIWTQLKGARERKKKRRKVAKNQIDSTWRYHAQTNSIDIARSVSRDALEEEQKPLQTGAVSDFLLSRKDDLADNTKENEFAKLMRMVNSCSFREWMEHLLHSVDVNERLRQTVFSVGISPEDDAKLWVRSAVASLANQCLQVAINDAAVFATFPLMAVNLRSGEYVSSYYENLSRCAFDFVGRLCYLQEQSRADSILYTTKAVLQLVGMNDSFAAIVHRSWTAKLASYFQQVQFMVQTFHSLAPAGDLQQLLPKFRLLLTKLCADIANGRSPFSGNEILPQHVLNGDLTFGRRSREGEGYLTGRPTLLEESDLLLTSGGVWKVSENIDTHNVFHPMNTDDSAIDSVPIFDSAVCVPKCNVLARSWCGLALYDLSPEQSRSCLPLQDEYVCTVLLHPVLASWREPASNIQKQQRYGDVSRTLRNGLGIEDVCKETFLSPLRPFAIACCLLSELAIAHDTGHSDLTAVNYGSFAIETRPVLNSDDSGKRNSNTLCVVAVNSTVASVHDMVSALMALHHTLSQIQRVKKFPVVIDWLRNQSLRSTSRVSAATSGRSDKDSVFEVLQHLLPGIVTSICSGLGFEDILSRLKDKSMTPTVAHSVYGDVLYRRSALIEAVILAQVCPVDSIVLDNFEVRDGRSVGSVGADPIGLLISKQNCGRLTLLQTKFGRDIIETLCSHFQSCVGNMKYIDKAVSVQKSRTASGVARHQICSAIVAQCRELWLRLFVSATGRLALYDASNRLDGLIPLHRFIAFAEKLSLDYEHALKSKEAFGFALASVWMSMRTPGQNVIKVFQKLLRAGKLGVATRPSLARSLLCHGVIWLHSKGIMNNDQEDGISKPRSLLEVILPGLSNSSEVLSSGLTFASYGEAPEMELVSQAVIAESIRKMKSLENTETLCKFSPSPETLDKLQDIDLLAEAELPAWFIEGVYKLSRRFQRSITIPESGKTATSMVFGKGLIDGYLLPQPINDDIEEGNSSNHLGSSPLPSECVTQLAYLLAKCSLSCYEPKLAVDVLLPHVPILPNPLSLSFMTTQLRGQSMCSIAPATVIDTVSRVTKVKNKSILRCITTLAEAYYRCGSYSDCVTVLNHTFPFMPLLLSENLEKYVYLYQVDDEDLKKYPHLCQKDEWCHTLSFRETYPARDEDELVLDRSVFNLGKLHIKSLCSAGCYMAALRSVSRIIEALDTFAPHSLLGHTYQAVSEALDESDVSPMEKVRKAYDVLNEKLENQCSVSAALRTWIHCLASAMELRGNILLRLLRSPSSWYRVLTSGEATWNASFLEMPNASHETLKVQILHNMLFGQQRSIYSMSWHKMLHREVCWAVRLTEANNKAEQKLSFSRLFTTGWNGDVFSGSWCFFRGAAASFETASQLFRLVGDQLGVSSSQLGAVETTAEWRLGRRPIPPSSSVQYEQFRSLDEVLQQYCCNDDDVDHAGDGQLSIVSVIYRCWKLNAHLVCQNNSTSSSGLCLGSEDRSMRLVESVIKVAHDIGSAKLSLRAYLAHAELLIFRQKIRATAFWLEAVRMFWHSYVAGNQIISCFHGDFVSLKGIDELLSRITRWLCSCRDSKLLNDYVFVLDTFVRSSITFKKSQELRSAEVIAPLPITVANYIASKCLEKSSLTSVEIPLSDRDTESDERKSRHALSNLIEPYLNCYQSDNSSDRRTNRVWEGALSLIQRGVSHALGSAYNDYQTLWANWKSSTALNIQRYQWSKTMQRVSIGTLNPLVASNIKTGRSDTDTITQGIAQSPGTRSSDSTLRQTASYNLSISDEVSQDLIKLIYATQNMILDIASTEAGYSSKADVVRPFVYLRLPKHQVIAADTIVAVDCSTACLQEEALAALRKFSGLDVDGNPTRTDHSDQGTSSSKQALPTSNVETTASSVSSHGTNTTDGTNPTAGGSCIDEMKEFSKFEESYGESRSASARQRLRSQRGKYSTYPPGGASDLTKRRSNLSKKLAVSQRHYTKTAAPVFKPQSTKPGNETKIYEPPTVIKHAESAGAQSARIYESPAKSQRRNSETVFTDNSFIDDSIAEESPEQENDMLSGGHSSHTMGHSSTSGSCRTFPSMQAPLIKLKEEYRAKLYSLLHLNRISWLSHDTVEAVAKHFDKEGSEDLKPFMGTNLTQPFFSGINGGSSFLQSTSGWFWLQRSVRKLADFSNVAEQRLNEYMLMRSPVEWAPANSDIRTEMIRISSRVRNTMDRIRSVVGHSSLVLASSSFEALLEAATISREAAGNPATLSQLKRVCYCLHFPYYELVCVFSPFSDGNPHLCNVGPKSALSAEVPNLDVDVYKRCVLPQDQFDEAEVQEIIKKTVKELPGNVASYREKGDSDAFDYGLWKLWLKGSGMMGTDSLKGGLLAAVDIANVPYDPDDTLFSSRSLRWMDKVVKQLNLAMNTPYMVVFFLLQKLFKTGEMTGAPKRAREEAQVTGFTRFVRTLFGKGGREEERTRVPAPPVIVVTSATSSTIPWESMFSFGVNKIEKTVSEREDVHLDQHHGNIEEGTAAAVAAAINKENKREEPANPRGDYGIVFFSRVRSLWDMVQQTGSLHRGAHGYLRARISKSSKRVFRALNPLSICILSSGRNNPRGAVLREVLESETLRKGISLHRNMKSLNRSHRSPYFSIPSLSGVVDIFGLWSHSLQDKSEIPRKDAPLPSSDTPQNSTELPVNGLLNANYSRRTSLTWPKGCLIDPLHLCRPLFHPVHLPMQYLQTHDLQLHKYSGLECIGTNNDIESPYALPSIIASKFKTGGINAAYVHELTKKSALKAWPVILLHFSDLLEASESLDILSSPHCAVCTVVCVIGGSNSMKILAKKLADSWKELQKNIEECDRQLSRISSQEAAYKALTRAVPMHWRSPGHFLLSTLNKIQEDTGICSIVINAPPVDRIEEG